jgi:hypothetical protein
MMFSFMIAGFVCAVAALCYSELASMVPVSGSAYTYTYAVMGERLAWMVGWALILEYAVAASAVCVGWSGYVMGPIAHTTGLGLPEFLNSGPAWGLNGFMPTVDFSHGVINLPAILVAGAVTWLLVLATSQSASVNAVLVAIKIVALTAFILLSMRLLKGENFSPLLPTGILGHDGLGVIGAAASIFFAYVGFDAVSTAAEETKNPQRNGPIGLIGSLGICTIFLPPCRRRRGRNRRRTAGARCRRHGPVAGRRGLRQSLCRVVATWRNAHHLFQGRPRRNAAADQFSTDWQPCRPGRLARPALGYPDDDLRPYAHLFRHGPRWPATACCLKAWPMFTRNTARPGR